jgi:aspartyl-tRNA(Asn)/glutamyl-tRNA(Gln) amidotransferase subunit B
MSSQLLVGIEIHARVKSNVKLFSGASAIARDVITGRQPLQNSLVAFLDSSIPGSMPKLNQYCVQQAIITGLALNGQIREWSRFERKHYFYCGMLFVVI